MAANSQANLPEVPLLGPDEDASPIDIDLVRLEPLVTETNGRVFQPPKSSTGQLQSLSSRRSTPSSNRSTPLSTAEMAHLLSSLLNPTGSGSPGVAATSTPAAFETPSSEPTINNIVDMGVPREKVVSLLNETLANSNDSVALNAAVKKGASWWKSLQSWWSKNGAATAPPTALFQLYANNIPLVTNSKDIDFMISLCTKKYDPTNISDSLHGLEDIGFFKDPDLVLAYHDNVNAPELTAALERRMEEFTEEKLNLVYIAIISRVFPFSNDLNDLKHATELFKTCATSLQALFSEARLDGQLRATLKRAVHSYAQKAGGLKNPDRRKQMEDFYNMKENQSIDGLSVDSFFFRERCPVFTKFGHPKVLGAGAYGLVLRYLRELPDSAIAAPEEYAIKLQRVTTEELKDLHTAAYVELRLLYEVNRAAPQLINNPGTSKAFANHVFLHDWVRCQFNAREQFTKFMSADQQNKYAAYLRDDKGIYQIYVEEFVTGGTLEDHLSSNAASFDRMASYDAFTGCMVQTLAHLETLGRLIKFSHHDMKPANVLVQRVPENTPIKYLVYENTSVGTLYLPLAHTNGLIMKVADYGRGRAEVPYKDEKGAMKLMHIGTTDEAAYNPAHDVENNAIMWLWFALSAKRANIGKGLDRRIFDFIYACVHDHRVGKSLGDQATSDYNGLLLALESWRDGKGFPALITWDRVQRFINRIYGDHLFEWENTPSKKDLDAFNVALSHPAMSRYKAKPQDFSAANSMVMNDYKLPISSTLKKS